MKNKRGFTLVELLAVIAILSIIMVITVPRVINQINDKKEKLLQTNEGLIIAAARNYVLDYNLGSELTIPLADMCDLDYLTCPIENPVTKANMNGYINIDSDKIYTYSETEATYLAHPTLTVNLKGGTSTQSFNSTYVEGYNLTLITPTKGGIEFTGWTVTGTGASLTGNVLKMGTGNTTLTATWAIPDYLLTVDANGGTWSGTSPQGVDSGSTVTIANPTKENYVFAGWTVNGTGSSINGTTFTMGTEDTTITATWANAIVAFSNSASIQTYTVPANGNYNIELWGAKGAASGSYTKGEIYLTSGTTLYLNVSPIYSGASDVRYNGQTLYDRIMVAAGGATNGVGTAGGAGGGLSGYAGGCGTGSGTSSCSVSGGGTQTSGGAGGGLICLYSASWQPNCGGGGGGFGVIGSISTSCGAGNPLGGQGGNGYWAGGSGASCNNGSSIQYGTGGGGGSSYISGHTGAIAIVSSSSTLARTGTGGAACTQGGTDNLCSVHYSGKYFTNTVMIDGLGYAWTNVKGSTTTMPNPAGGNYASGGNTTDGYAKISYIGS